MDRLFLEILNSNRVDWQDDEHPRDMLDDDPWLEDLAQKSGVEVTGDIPVTLRNRLKRLREDMRAMVSALDNGLPPNTTAIDAALAAMPVRFHLRSYQGEFCLEREVAMRGWPEFVWLTAYSFASLLNAEDSSRLKVCHNENCGWIFYDDTRNKTRRWCDSSVCGNIMKARRFRSRHKVQSTSKQRN